MSKYEFLPSRWVGARKFSNKTRAISTISLGAENLGLEYPTPLVLNFSVDPDDMRALGVLAFAPKLYYRFNYTQESGEVDLQEGNFLSSNGVEGASPWNVLGHKIQVPAWAGSLSLFTLPNNPQNDDWGTNELRVYFAFSVGSPGGGGNTNPLTQKLGDPSDYLPRYARQARVQAPVGAVGANFSFKDSNETVIVSYPLGPSFVGVPPNAVKILGSLPGLFADLTLY